MRVLKNLSWNVFMLSLEALKEKNGAFLIFAKHLGRRESGLFFFFFNSPILLSCVVHDSTKRMYTVATSKQQSLTRSLH